MKKIKLDIIRLDDLLWKLEAFAEPIYHRQQRWQPEELKILTEVYPNLPYGERFPELKKLLPRRSVSAIYRQAYVVRKTKP